MGAFIYLIVGGDGDLDWSETDWGEAGWSDDKKEKIRLVYLPLYTVSYLLLIARRDGHGPCVEQAGLGF
jgi:hypothetical protein